jgi:VIT1/CCC1 family predicted Fe2+/Mn2+ transporter
MDADPRFIASATATAVAFFSVGVIKGKIVERALMRSGFETLLIRGMAATSHISLGAWLRHAYGAS